MSTKEKIVVLGDQLLRNKGFNAFSFHEIANLLGIKSASVHYHFPSKSSLAIAVIDYQQQKISSLLAANADKTPVQQLEDFLQIYSQTQQEGNVCIVGALATDLHTVEPDVRQKIKELAANIIVLLTNILSAGKQQHVFHFMEDARTKALLIITNMLASVQIARLTSKEDFYYIQQAVLKNLLQNNE